MTSVKTQFAQYRQILAYGLCLSVLLFFLKWLQWRFIILENSLDIYIGLIALFFTVLGVWLAGQLSKPKTRTIIVEKEVYPTSTVPVSNGAELQKLGLTTREWEVLQEMATGKSNIEIADSLCLSLSTVKTHASNLFVKMGVKSRTRAMEKAKRLGIIP